MKATPRTTAPSGIYSPNKQPMRPGSEDFLRCPSLILGQRRPPPAYPSKRERGTP